VRAAEDALRGRGSPRASLLDYLNDLVAGFFIRDPRTRRLRTLRRKLIRYVANAPSAAFLGSDPRHLDARGEIRSDVRRRVTGIARAMPAPPELEWDLLCAEFTTRAERELPGVVVQLPPDEPRMAYAGDKPL
jgi:hypothetical protein